MAPRQVPRLITDDTLPQIFFGGAVFGTSYNTLEHLSTDEPTQVLCSALRAGIDAIDTAPFYSISEQLIGSILAQPHVRNDFPRSSYRLFTKCGRYGTKRHEFDYSGPRLRESVATSCHRLQTDYLDGVYLHDVEFVAEDVGSACAGGHALQALEVPNLSRYGLAPDQASVIHGPGDQTIIDAVAALFAMKDQGQIHRVGIAGYPLPTLLRIARLVRARLGRPLDLVQSYSHLTLQNDALLAFIPLFRRAGVRQIVNSSPLSMGLLRAEGPQSWHPAPAALKLAATSSVPYPQRAALQYGLRAGLASGVPTTVGCSTLGELDEALEAFWAGERPTASSVEQEEVRRAITGVGFATWSWASPPDASYKPDRVP